MFKTKRIFGKIVDLILLTAGLFLWWILFLSFVLGIIISNDVELFNQISSMTEVELNEAINSWILVNEVLFLRVSVVFLTVAGMINTILYFGISGIWFASTPGKVIFDLNVYPTNSKRIGFWKYIWCDPLSYLQVCIFLSFGVGVISIICFMILIIYFNGFLFDNKLIKKRFNTEVY